jgi:hypothetical protein
MRETIGIWYTKGGKRLEFPSDLFLNVPNDLINIQLSWENTPLLSLDRSVSRIVILLEDDKEKEGGNVGDRKQSRRRLRSMES